MFITFFFNQIKLSSDSLFVDVVKELVWSMPKKPMLAGAFSTIWDIQAELVGD